MKEISASGRRPGRWLAPLGGGLSLVAAAVLIAALFPTFVSQVCPGGCSGISASLGESPDAWAVAWIAGILAATALLFLARTRVRLIAMLNAFASLGALGLAVIEGVMAFPRVLGSAELVPGGVVHALGAGYYLFLIGAVVAVGAAGAMLLAHGDGGREFGLNGMVRRLGAAVICRASLCVIALACVGAFLPFATVSCGFGCPPDTPAFALYSGGLVAGFDGPILIALLAFAALATLVRMTGQGTVRASAIALLTTLAATVLVSFDSLNGATSVLGWPYAIPTVPAPGYYVLQTGTALCVVLSALLVTADHPTWGILRRVRVGAPDSARTA